MAENALVIPVTPVDGRTFLIFLLIVFLFVF